MKIYGIAGKARSGKDTVADIIAKHYQDKKVVIYPCTKYLKDYVMSISNWDGKDDTKPRELLQSTGKKIKEKYPNFFTKRIEEDLKVFSNYCDIIIVTGLRLIPELELLKNNYNIILIKVESKTHNGLTESQRNDITEIEVDNYVDYDFVIDNDGDKDELKNKIKKIIEEW